MWLLDTAAIGIAARVNGEVWVKGWPNSWIRIVPAAGAAEKCRQENWLPTATNSENGIRNFSEAASQSEYRTRAEFFRRAKVSNPAAAAKRVDCHK